MMPTCRGGRSYKRWAILMMIAMVLSGPGGPLVIPTAKAQGPIVGAGFTLNAGDLRFIFRQIRIAENHSAGNDLFGPGPNQVPEVRQAFGLRTVDGSMNHLVDGQTKFGAADQIFRRLTPPLFRAADGGTSYTQKSGVVSDSQPRVASNLIVDQTMNNPAAVLSAAAVGTTAPDASGTLFIPNTAPDVGLSAPFNIMLTFFGQFFDHGLDLVNKGGSGVVMVPLPADDPLIVGGDGIAGNDDDPQPPLPANMRFMAVTRATNLPGPDGILGNDDDIMEDTNQTTPFVDQNQTYTSHPSHQVFLREYVLDGTGRPRSTGRMIDGFGGAIGTWAEVKDQALTMLGVELDDQDVFNVPMMDTDAYGYLKRNIAGFPQMYVVNPGGSISLVEVRPDAPVDASTAVKTGHAFLDDIAHNAAPKPGLAADGDSDVSVFGVGVQPAGTYDDELLNRHFVTGDGRGNENIALTAVHTVFHSEHNRLANEIGYGRPDLGIQALIDSLLPADEAAAWRVNDPASGWGYGERVFQAARFVTEMEYQHLVFEEFARTLVPSINPFIGDGINFQSDTNPAIVAEFAHATYRLGHSMLTESIPRTFTDGRPDENISLVEAFLNPLEFNKDNTLSARESAGSIFQAGTREVANEVDEFVTEALRNRLLGLPLDLATINLARGRSEGVTSLNNLRRSMYLATADGKLAPYPSWAEFSFDMRHPESVVNFIAAYGKNHSALDAAVGRNAKRSAAQTLVDASDPWLFDETTDTGLNDVDLWVGGLAEKQSPFGGLLGSTFTHVFEVQLESLQNADRFYYLERLDGLNLLAQMEANSFSELISRNTTATGMPQGVFTRPGLVINLGELIPDDGNGFINDPSGGDLVRLPNGTIRYLGAEHVLWNGTSNGESVFSSEGDDTFNGGDGNDRWEGGSGNDTPVGGLGDDILIDLFGDDVLKGGPGNDAISGGSGAFDLLQGNEGDDYIIAGNDFSETFGGPGDDVIFTGEAGTEAFGGSGDDWIEGGPQLDLLVGDENNQFQNDSNGGHDVIIGGKGDDDYDSEGGDDIMVGDVLGTERFEGMLGFDLVTYRGDALPVDSDMNINIVLAPNLDELRDRFDLTEGMSGYDKDDILRGTDRIADDMVGHELNAAGSLRIRGLRALLGGATTFTGGDILMGGAGSDLIEGRGGNDVIDGDAWLNVQLVGTLNDGTVRRANSLFELREDVFANPQRLNPGNIDIDRFIVSDDSAPGDIDVALFTGPRADYLITPNANGSVTVNHNGGVVGGVLPDGVDTLWNIERLRFSDMEIATPGGAGDVNAPNVTTLSEAAAIQAIADAPGDLIVGAISRVNNNDVAAGIVLDQTPLGGVGVETGSAIALVISLGPLVPDVHDHTVVNGVPAGFPAAQDELAVSGLTLGTITRIADPEVEEGLVITQDPLPGATVAPHSAINVTVSTGPAGPTIVGHYIRNTQNALQVTTPAFNAVAQSLLVAFVAADAHVDSPNTIVNSMTNNGAPLVWTNAVRSNVQLGTAEIWWAYTTAARNNLTVKAMLSNAVAATLSVIQVTGADPSMLGAAMAATNAASGAPNATLTTTRARSLVIGVGMDWDSPRNIVVPANQTRLHLFRPTVGDTYWVQHVNGQIATAGTAVTLSARYGAVGAAMPDRWNMAAIEIRITP